MTLWGCRLGAGFADCASTSYTALQIVIVSLVAGAVAVLMFYYGGRLLIRLLGL